MAQATPLSGKRLIVAEDNALVAEDICLVLESAGAVVLARETDALRFAKLADDGEFDCAILDVQLQNGSSVGVARALLDRKVPFVLVTGYGSRSLPFELRSAPFLSKPFQREALIEAVARALK